MGKDQFAAVELLWDILNGKTKEVSKVTYFPQKPDMPQDAKINQPFPRATPESQGIPSERLSAMIEELSRYPWLDVHHVLVIRNGKMICECSFSPYRPNIWHSSYSLCKSITGLAIGMLYDKGKIHLDTPITEFFKDKDRSRMSFRQKKITVENLLTMTSGVDFHEAGAYTGDDWVKGYLGASVREMPGEIFDYNSMNSYMLSAIVTAVTGQSLMDFLTPRLWKPLGITNVFWETCPMGITKGGWGLFICPECAHEWAAGEASEAEEGLVVKDAHGNRLADGDAVTIIKDLKVKGASSSLKIGTKVKNIRLVEGDHNIDCQIEGFGAMKLKSEFVKKA